MKATVLWIAASQASCRKMLHCFSKDVNMVPVNKVLQRLVGDKTTVGQLKSLLVPYIEMMQSEDCSEDIITYSERLIGSRKQE